jgi:hypothetical protein
MIEKPAVHPPRVAVQSDLEMSELWNKSGLSVNLKTSREVSGVVGGMLARNSSTVTRIVVLR